MKYDTIIFDLDGTLLDTLDDLTGAVNYSLSRLGFPARSREEVRRFVGNGLRRLMEQAVPEPLENEAFDAMFASFKEYYTEHCRLETKPYPGIIPLLRELKGLGCRMAIVSNKNDAAVKALSAYYFSDTMETAIGEQAGVRRKPAPDTVEKARRLLNAEKERCLYIGDSEVDKETADHAGIDCVLVDWGFRDRAQLEPLGAKAVIHQPSQLPALL